MLVVSIHATHITPYGPTPHMHNSLEYNSIHAKYNTHAEVAIHKPNERNFITTKSHKTLFKLTVVVDNSTAKQKTKALRGIYEVNLQDRRLKENLINRKKVSARISISGVLKSAENVIRHS